MKYLNKEIKFDEAIEKEWIITNGIGGYSSSTILGANTRKYHGLLVASLTPPARRHVILSKVDESIEIDGKKTILYTNMGRNYIADGYKNLDCFQKEYLPVFMYEIGDVKISKVICMEYGKNTVCILYKIKNGSKSAKLNLAPLLNFRDFHSLSANARFEVRQTVSSHKIKVILDNNVSYPVYFKCSEGQYIEHQNDYYYNMYYVEEEKRGFYAEENHCVPGHYEIEIEPNEEKEITFTCSLEENIEEINARNVINNEISRLQGIIFDTKLIEDDENSNENHLIRDLIIASDNFVVYRPSFRLHTLIAGYHWFLDWGRDALIAFEGLLLITRRFSIAKEVLFTFIRNIKYGLVPNGYSGFDNRPLYNSVDSSLLLFEQINRYVYYTGDYKFVKAELYVILEKIIESYTKGIDFDDNNIYLDDNNLIVSGTKDTQNTWMDAKVGNCAITPRNGNAVEINAMWYNTLKTMEFFSNKFGKKDKAKKYKEMAELNKKAFKEKFYNKEKKCLYDVVGDDKIRPNQLFSLALTYPVIEPNSAIADEIIETVKLKLLNPYGLKTLAKGEEGYVEVYDGDGTKRDRSYHQGITWPWLLGIYQRALKNRLDAEKNRKRKKQFEEEYNDFLKNVKNTFTKAIYQDGAVGSISEIYDSREPYIPRGTVAQAWSVSEIFRIIQEEKKVNKNENIGD